MSLLKIVFFAVMLSTVCFTNFVKAWWLADIEMELTPSSVSFIVLNISDDNRIFCKGTIYGQTQFGQWVKMPVQTTLSPGQFMKKFVFTNPYKDPFVDGYADIKCHYK